MPLVRVCCVCKRSEHNGVWDYHDHHKAQIETRNATHGYCPPCHKNVMDEIEQDRKEK